MLTYSIPSYRMPKDVMAAQVRALESMGIRFELGAALGGAEGRTAAAQGRVS
jgi:NADPH-dependent glutamate synthase beta subunit-like oxidoreductase